MIHKLPRHPALQWPAGRSEQGHETTGGLGPGPRWHRMGTSTENVVFATDSPARCLGCGYSLNALVERRCPECGRPFDPGDPATYRGKDRDIWQLLDRPPGRFSRYGMLTAAIALLIDSAWPGGTFCLASLVFFVGLVTAAVWLMRALVRMTEVLLGRGPWPSGPREWQAWAAVPAIALLTVALLWADVPLRLVFFASRPAMDRWAAHAMQAPVGTKLPDGWVGLYGVRDAERFPDGVRFFVRWAFFDQEGWAYLPAGLPRRSGDNSYHPVAGFWYLWHWTF